MAGSQPSLLARGETLGKFHVKAQQEPKPLRVSERHLLNKVLFKIQQPDKHLKNKEGEFELQVNRLLKRTVNV